MAIKHICDRCGAEINPPSSGKRISFPPWCDDTRDLCVSCFYKLELFLAGKDDLREGVDE